MTDTSWMSMLPTLNAILNTTSAILATCGWIAIRRGVRKAHIAAMVGALICSTLFLISYLTYHAYHGSTRFEAPSLIRTVYLIILLTHTVLAAVIVPLILIAVAWAIKGNFSKHKRLARWVAPLWLYVSVTGVTIYLMLYHLGPRLASP
jgi:putative membrane protein